MKGQLSLLWLYPVVAIVAPVLWYFSFELSENYILSSGLFGLTVVLGILTIGRALGFRKAQKRVSCRAPILVFDALMVVAVMIVFPLWSMLHGLIILLLMIGVLSLYHPTFGRNMMK